jgi:uncharacterized protein
VRIGSRGERVYADHGATMTDQNNQEPTMEEILASIRRIISEDDPPSDEAAAAPGEPVALPELDPEPPPPATQAFEQAAAPAVYDDVLELTDKLDGDDAAPVESVGDLDVFSAAPVAPPEPLPPPAPEPVAAAPRVAESSFGDEGLLSTPAAASAATAFASLSGAIGMPRDDRTLEDVVRELLRPLLKQWLDENEVERVSRRGGV